MKDLWEPVQVYNVNVGDVVMINTYGHPATIYEGQIDKYGGIGLAGYYLHSHDTVFRRIPETEDPRVLRRALDLASDQVVTLTHVMLERKGPVPPTDAGHYAASCIEKARKEFKSESGE